MTSIKLVKYPINVEKIESQVFECLDHYQWSYNTDIVRQIVNDCLTNKANVIDTLSTDPDWDWEKLAIHRKSNYEQVVDERQLNDCSYWLYYKMKDIPVFNDVVKDLDPLRSIKSIRWSISMFGNILRNFDFIESAFGKWTADNTVIFGNTREQASTRLKNLKKIEKNKCDAFTGVYTPECLQRRFDFDNFRVFIKDVATSEKFTTGEYKGKWNKEAVAEFNSYAKKLNCTTTAKVGQKFSKPILALLIELGYDKIEGEKSSFVDTWGWNQFKAKLGDAVSPQSYTRHTLLSVHPVDFLRMSMGNSWQSCHTIDKLQLDNREGDSYEGQYCQGTLSYMRDSVSFVYYTAKETLPDNADFCFEDKYTRQMFHIGSKENPFFVQGRMYPQSNDTGSKGLYAQYRQNVEAILAKAWDCENQWEVKPSRENSGYFNSEGGHYRDYTSYDACRLCVQQEVDLTTLQPITIGSESICIECGYSCNDNTINCCNPLGSNSCCLCSEHRNDYLNWSDTEDNYLCDNCSGYCDYCRTYHRIDDFNYRTVNDEYICERELNESDRYVYCEDIDEYAEYDETYYCEYNGCNYYDLDNAKDDGYYFYDGEFWTIEDLYNHGFSEEEIDEITAA